MYPSVSYSVKQTAKNIDVVKSHVALNWTWEFE